MAYRPIDRTSTSNSQEFPEGKSAIDRSRNGQIDDLKIRANYTNLTATSPMFDSNRDKWHSVFRGEVNAGFTRSGEIVRVINNLAPAWNIARLSSNFSDPVDAVTAAAKHINHTLTDADVTRNAAGSSDLKVVFGEGDCDDR